MEEEKRVKEEREQQQQQQQQQPKNPADDASAPESSNKQQEQEPPTNAKEEEKEKEKEKEKENKDDAKEDLAKSGEDAENKGAPPPSNDIQTSVPAVPSGCPMRQPQQGPSSDKGGRGRIPKAQVLRAEDVIKQAVPPQELTDYMAKLFDFKRQKIVRFK